MVTEGVDGVRRSIVLVCVDAAQVDAYNACSEQDNPAGGAGLGLVLQKKADGVAGESGVLVGHVITGSVADLSGRIGLYDRVLKIDDVPVFLLLLLEARPLEQRHQSGHPAGG